MRKLYLDAWNFNKSVLLDKIEQIALNNGAELKGYYHPGIIERRSNGFTRETNHCDTFGGYVSFVLDGDYIYAELDNNPFFDFHMTKIKLNDGTYNGTYFSNNIDKSDWMYDCLFTDAISESELTEIAYLLWNYLCKANHSQRYYERQKRRVSNIYNNRYHYEYVDVTDKATRKPTERKALNY